MPTINTTQFPADGYVLVEVDWTDYPQVLYAGVTRRNTVTGEIVTLRPYAAYDGDGNLLLSCGLGLWWDTEPPLNVELEYCTFPADPETLLTTNEDFETGIAPWVGSNGVATQSGAFSHSGSFSGLLTPSGSGTFTQIINNDNSPAYLVGVPIVAKAWVLSPQGWNAVQLTLSLFNTSDGTFDSVSSPIEIIDDGQWTFLTATFNPVKPGIIDSIRVLAWGVVPATTLFYVDEVGAWQQQPLAVSACATETIVSNAIWLKSPLSPCSDVLLGICDPTMDFDCEDDSRVTYVGMAEDILDANTVLSEPANRVYPIPVSRRRRAPRSELRVLAHDCDARDAVLLANEPGTPLLFQAPDDYCIPDRYISVDALGEQRVSIDQREDFRLMTLPYATVDRPEGPANGICGSRIDDLCDLYTSWTAITLAGLDYADLIEGFASNDGPVNPLPPDARTWGDVDVEFADWAAVDAGGTRDWGELEVGL